ncbi:MAG: DNA repair protein RecN [Flavobacteriales bacterium]|nr:DNA repair protein RecN [Flavobacteriales bacterium]|tara:strand:- start:2465 stop:4123 length:1659 start_codon:yes stop_codon:yes gene_type:complete
MLNRLSINNYALIDELSIDFKKGFTTITGETGAGKSILLSALGLTLGERAELKAIADANKKCVVEGEIIIDKYDIQSFFEIHDLDYLNPTLIRREIAPSGRSRAFVNDTPVSLNQLKELGSYLIDIHSQHQTLLLNSQNYQLKIVDVFCNHKNELSQFQNDYQSYFSKQTDLDELLEKEKQISRELDYKQFLFDELEGAKLTNQDSKIEDELSKLENFEEIQHKLNQIISISDNEESSVSSLLSSIVMSIDSIKEKDSNLVPINDRLNSLWIEFKDCLSELESIASSYSIDFDVKQFLFLQERFNLVNKLFQKHNVQTIEQLMELHSDLSKELERFHTIDSSIESLKKDCKNTFIKASDSAKKLSKNRLAILPVLEKELISLLSNLGMPSAKLKINTNSFDDLTIKGYEDFTFCFSSNKGVDPMEISKIASGGELSRLMLCFKYVLAQKTNLPTIIFDEIDAGVSGEIAHKMAGLMSQMSKSMQVIGITHLPQVAAKGNVHLLVSKAESTNRTQTVIKELKEEERVDELAKMLSGKSITESSLSNARDLLNT